MGVDESAESFKFLFRIGNTGKNKIVQGNKPVLLFHYPYGAFDISECISPGPVVAVIINFLSRIKTHSEAVKTGIGQLFNAGGQAGVGVEVNGSF